MAKLKQNPTESETLPLLDNGSSWFHCHQECSTTENTVSPEQERKIQSHAITPDAGGRTVNPGEDACPRPVNCGHISKEAG